MKAIYIQKHGPVSEVKVSEIPRPSIKPGEVLVKIEAAGINPSDIVSLEGRFPNSVLPRVVGRDFAGTVAEGPADLVGRKVWGTGGDLGVTRDGTHAEYLVIPQEAAVQRPQNLSPEQAAAVGVPYAVAFLALVNLAKLKEGEWVLVSGAAGAVGQATIDVAHAKGGRVIALIKDANQRSVSESPKVQAVAQSDRGDLGEVTRKVTNGKGADIAMNGVGSSLFAELQAALGLGGRQVVYSAAGGKEASIDLFSFYKHQLALFGLDTQKLSVTQGAETLAKIVSLFESGALDGPVIQKTYTLSDAAKAYEYVAQRKGGKVVFVMNGERGA